MVAPSVLCLAAWGAVMLPWRWAVAVAAAAAAASAVALCANRPRGSRPLVAATVGASLVVACTHHAGVLLLAWMVSGAALTMLVRREGGETSGKPGRILEMQQHAASALLLALVPAVVHASGTWSLDARPASFGDRACSLLAAAGVREGRAAWNLVIASLVALIAALRLGIFPFPFSLRRSARRLQGVPLLALLAVFLPCSIAAVGRLHSALHGTAGSLTPAVAALGCVAVVTGALWLYVEWLAESVLGEVAQCYAGLALLSFVFDDATLTSRVVVQGAIALIAGAAWATRMRDLLHTSDLSKVSRGYEGAGELHATHAVFVVVACPVPGTPGGQVWMGILGRHTASGTGFGLVVFLGAALLCAALVRSIRKASTRLRDDRHDDRAVPDTGI